MGSGADRHFHPASPPCPLRPALRPWRLEAGAPEPAAATEEGAAGGGRAGATLTAHGGRCSRSSRVRGSAHSRHSALRRHLALLGSGSGRWAIDSYNLEPSAWGGAEAEPPPLPAPHWPPVVVTTAGTGPLESGKPERGGSRRKFCLELPRRAWDLEEGLGDADWPQPLRGTGPWAKDGIALCLFPLL